VSGQQQLIKQESSDTVIATVSKHPQGQSPSRDLRSAMMTLPVAEMQTVLAEYSDRRKAFREWLLPQLKEGVHFGYPPGVKPQFDERGWLKSWNNKKNSWDFIPPEQWTVKPSFYKAGAQFVADVMNVLPTFDADMDAWKQLGEPVGTFVFRCRLYPKGALQLPETLVGEGRGVRKNGQKGGDENNAIKMAQKCAFVDAVLNGYGLADLFTQDMEDAPQQPPNPPDADDRKPTTPPRGERVTEQDCIELQEAWKGKTGNTGPTARNDYIAWCEANCAIPAASVFKVAAWTKQAIEHGYNALRRMK
jgi:hypothetical protein